MAAGPASHRRVGRWAWSASAPTRVTGGGRPNGYVNGDTTIRCFSHVHGRELYGIAVLPVTGDVPKPWDMDSTAATFSHDDEIVHPGYHKVFLRNYGVAELTSACRVGFHRYTFPKEQKRRG